MARRRRAEEERSMDSLMDALTNVVGILLLILIVSSLGISAAVRKVVENIPDVTEEELEMMKSSRDKTLTNLQELTQTYNNTQKNLPTEDEAAELIAELEEFEKNNEELADKTSDIDEWKRKVEEEEAKKDENEEKVRVADERNRELAAILAQTPEVEIKEAKEILLPNPRKSDSRTVAVYFVCRHEKLYYVGDPYDHALKIRDVIEQNFQDLAFRDKKLGSFTYAVRGTKRSDTGNSYLPLDEGFNLTNSARKELAAWDNVKATWLDGNGNPTTERSVLDRIFRNEDRKDLQIHKFRYSLVKIENFFKGGVHGPTDFHYYVKTATTKANEEKGRLSDRVKFSIAPKEQGGWTEEEFLAPNSEFHQLCKKASVNRDIVFYYYVAPDSFDTYLTARTLSENYRVGAGWDVWNTDTLALKAIPERTTIRYDLDKLPAEEYRKIADVVGPFLVSELSKEIENFDELVAAAVPAEMTNEQEKKKFIAELTKQRKEWDVKSFQPYAIAPFQAALAATKARGDAEIQLEVKPPEIPGIRVFVEAKPPGKLKDPPVTGTRKTNNNEPKEPTLILD